MKNIGAWNQKVGHPWARGYATEGSLNSEIVSHEILLKKLSHYGIRGRAYGFTESYLNSRTQFVSINNCQSQTKPINIGVPQGSILCPLLFLIYINDLHNAVTKPRLFADDTCLEQSFSNCFRNKLQFGTKEVTKLV